MIPAAQFNRQSVGVFGLGKTGVSAVQSLIAGGAQVYVWDDSEKSRAEVNATPVENWPWHKLAALVLSPGIPFTHPAPHPVVKQAQAAKIPIFCDIEILLREQREASFIGITGTNGKSTTTALTAHLLREAGKTAVEGGNLGMPALTLPALGKGAYYVLELSSYQLDLIVSPRFSVAALLNLTPDHLDRHGDMAGYANAKSRIFSMQAAHDTAVIGTDDSYSRAILEMVRQRPNAPHVIPISIGAKETTGIYYEKGALHYRDQRIELEGIDSLRGTHNAQNAAASWAVAMSLGIDTATVQKAMRTFPGLAHRMEQVAVHRGVRFVNDSKATNADAAAKALDAFKPIYWIAGGKAKEGGIESLAPYFPNIRRAYLIGEAEEAFAKTLESKLEYTRCGALAQALAQAAEDAFREKLPGATVLLSPACASFDQWPNFEARGDAFRKLVQEMR